MHGAAHVAEGQQHQEGGGQQPAGTLQKHHPCRADHGCHSYRYQPGPPSGGASPQLLHQGKGQAAQPRAGDAHGVDHIHHLGGEKAGSLVVYYGLRQHKGEKIHAELNGSHKSYMRWRIRTDAFYVPHPFPRSISVPGRPTSKGEDSPGCCYYTISQPVQKVFSRILQPRPYPQVCVPR